MGGIANTEMVIGGLRFHRPGGQDEVHSHDDKSGLKFTYKGCREFSLRMAMLLRELVHEQGSTPFVFSGEDGDKAADLLLERKKDGWHPRLVPKGSKTTGVRGACDKNLALLDDFIHRI